MDLRETGIEEVNSMRIGFIDKLLVNNNETCFSESRQVREELNNYKHFKESNRPSSYYYCYYYVRNGGDCPYKLIK
jgi:hypothetical protein